MAALPTERGVEYVTVSCQNVLMRESGLNPLGKDKVAYVDVHGNTGIAGVLDDVDPRAQDARDRFSQCTAKEILSHNSFMLHSMGNSRVDVRAHHVDSVVNAAPKMNCTDGSSPNENEYRNFSNDVNTNSSACEYRENDYHVENSVHRTQRDDPDGQDHKHQSAPSVRTTTLEETPTVFMATAKPVSRRRALMAQARAQVREKRFEQNSPAYPPSTFAGVMMDSGSSASVCSPAQLEAYRSATGFMADVQQVKSGWLRSMHGQAKILGTATFRVPKNGCFLEFAAKVSDGDSPLIMGLSDQRRFGLKLNTLTNMVEFSDGKLLPLVARNGHLFLDWLTHPEECLYTAPELTKLHLRFGHPSSKKLYEFLMRATPDELDADTRRILDELTARCRGCQRTARAPVRFRVSLPDDNFAFNREVIVDLFTISGRTVLSIVDRDTRFVVCKFMPSNTDVKAQDVWRVLQEAWALTYLGWPDTLRHDRGVQFVATQLQTAAAEVGMRCVTVGVEAANAMGIGERIHGPIRRIFEKIKSENSEVDDDAFILHAACKAFNDCNGVDGLVPTLLVFGAYPKIPLPNSADHALPQRLRMRILDAARLEYQAIVDAARLDLASKPGVPTPSLPVGLTHGTSVVVYRGTTNRWEPATFLYESGPLVYVRAGRDVNPFPREKVKIAASGLDLAHKEKNPSDLQMPQQSQSSEPRILASDRIRDTDESRERALYQAAGQYDMHDVADPAVVDSFLDDSAVFYAQPQAPSPAEVPNLLNDVLATEVLTSKDPRRGEFADAIKLELGGLSEKDVFEEVNVPAQARQSLNVLRSRFVLAFKNPDTHEQVLKARLVVQALPHLDKDKPRLFTFSPTISKASFRLMLSLAASLDYPVFIRDVSQAFVCAEYDLLRDAFVVPPKELNLPKNVLWRLKKPLYGLPESGLLWYETYRRHHEMRLQMATAITDPCLLSSHDHEGLQGLVCLQVDDSAIAGTKKFLDREDTASKYFPTKGRRIVDESGISFNGSVLSRRGCNLIMEQRAYVHSIPSSPCVRTPSAFGTLRGKLSYATSNTRPEFACSVNFLAQRVADRAQEEDFVELDRVNRSMHAADMELTYEPLDLSSIELHVYSDASHANCDDLHSQLGHTVFLRDKNARCSLLTWSSCKSKRITRSVLAAELFALSGAYDIGFSIRHTLSALLGREITMRVFTDSKTLFHSVTNLCAMTERRLLIDIAGLRDAYRSGDLAEFGQIDSKDNPADSMTKKNASDCLVRVLYSRQLKHPVLAFVGTGRLPSRR